MALQEPYVKRSSGLKVARVDTISPATLTNTRTLLIYESPHESIERASPCYRDWNPRSAWQKTTASS